MNISEKVEIFDNCYDNKINIYNLKNINYDFYDKISFNIDINYNEIK